MDKKTPSTLQERLRAECGQLSWPELAPHFARGAVVRVAAGLDLIEVAVKMAEDDRARIEAWLAQGLVARAVDDDARRWTQASAQFRAVVVAPWVLVQAEAEESPWQ